MPRNIPVGNGSLLINFDHTYQIRDIYWPHVGQQNHTAGGVCRFGMYFDGRFYWLDDSGWSRQLLYAEDSLVTRVELRHPDLPFIIRCVDGVDFHTNVFLREVEVENLTDTAHELRLFFGLDLAINGHSVGDSAYYEPERKCLFHYKEKSWFVANAATCVDETYTFGIDQWAVGVKGLGHRQGAWKDAEDGTLSGNGVAQGSVDSVLALHLQLAAGKRATGYYWLGVGHTFQDVRLLNRMVRLKKPKNLLERTENYWRLWANKDAHQFACISETLCDLYRRSLLILRSQIDNEGAILAANDFDIAHFNRDTYSYMWPRDGALVAAGLITSGYSEISRNFFDFCHRVITEEGYLLHKYNPDGSLASSWHGWDGSGEKQLPIQEDETALVLWALWRHFDTFRDIEYIKHHYRGLIIRAANWLTRFVHKDCDLPLPSWDLWEERHGVHGWTVGAVYGGLIAAANFAEAFGETETAVYYRDTAARLKKSVDSYMWMSDENRFCRTVTRVEDGQWRQDRTMDASLCGLWYFGMYNADDDKILATMQAMRETLWVKTAVGGMARYENDYYHQVSDNLQEVPGNPWFICTLWLAQWYVAKAGKANDLDDALTLINWCAARALDSGVMAEQVHPYTNAPMSVSPLTWSHATLVVTINEYLEKEREFSSP